MDAEPGKSMGYIVENLQKAFDDFSKFLQPDYDYSKVGFSILDKRPW